MAYCCRWIRIIRDIDKLMSITNRLKKAKKNMKRSQLSKVAGAGVIALSLAILPGVMPASAQTDTAPAGSNTNNDPNRTVVDTTPLQESESDNNHWGALGLLGLIGLANLFRKDEPTRFRDPDPAATSTTRY